MTTKTKAERIAKLYNEHFQGDRAHARNESCKELDRKIAEIEAEDD